jgi:hypothetical protein
MTSFMEAFNTELAEAASWSRLEGSPHCTHQTVCAERRAVRDRWPIRRDPEVLAGYWIVECDSFDRATEIAGRLAACPAPEQVAANAYADIRPIMESAEELTY